MTTDETKLKTHDIILLVLLGMFFVFGILAFFIEPKAADIAIKVVEGISIAIGMVLSFKFGVHQAQVQPGATQVSNTTTPPATPEGPTQ